MFVVYVYTHVISACGVSSYIFQVSGCVNPFCCASMNNMCKCRSVCDEWGVSSRSFSFFAGVWLCGRVPMQYEVM